MRLVANAFRIVYVLWAGSLWSLAVWVATTVFALEPDRQLAGRIAARLFGIETYLGAALALVALLLPSRARFFWTYPAAALLLCNEWVLKPLMSEARLRGPVYGLSFGAWHGVSALLYVGACLAVALLVWRDELGGGARVK
jgi:hypothetical protein